MTATDPGGEVGGVTIQNLESLTTDEAEQVEAALWVTGAGRDRSATHAALLRCPEFNYCPVCHGVEHPPRRKQHDVAADMVLKALDGPRGGQVASAVIHAWLLGNKENVPPEQTTAIVSRWPYGAQVQDLMGQVERLSLIVHMERRLRGIHGGAARAPFEGKMDVIIQQIRDYLSKTIRDKNARKALGL